MAIHDITPKLVVESADEAIAFYRNALGARLTQRYVVNGKVVFAEIELGGHVIELKDADEYDEALTEYGARTLFSVTCDDPDAFVQTVADAGGEVIFPVTDQPYGVRGGRVRDPFGYKWLAQTPNKLTPEEIQESLDGA